MGIVERLRLWGDHGLRSSLDDLKQAADIIEALETQTEGYKLALAEQLEIRQELETELDRCRATNAVMDNTVKEKDYEIAKLSAIVCGWHYLAVGPDEMGDYYTHKQLMQASEPYASPALRAIVGGTDGDC